MLDSVHLYVDDIRPVIWNDEAYDHLVYPEEQKDLVLTFVKSHQQTKTGLNDVIAGKGGYSTAPPVSHQLIKGNP